MSDSDTERNGTGSLEALALAETLAELRAAGETPRLGQLLAALNMSPDAAGALIDALLASLDDADYPDDADNADSDGQGTLSPGTQRGLAAIFGADDEAPAPLRYHSAHEDNDANGANGAGAAPALVAETSVIYQTDQTERAGDALLALARARRLDAEALAARVMLTPAALRWLDQVALPLARQPEALVAHLVGALEVEHARIRAALATGELLTGADAAAPLAELLIQHGALTPAQRDYWNALLSSTA